MSRRVSHVTRSRDAPAAPTPSAADAEAQLVDDGVDLEELPPEQPPLEVHDRAAPETESGQEPKILPVQRQTAIQRRPRAEPAPPRREPPREYKPKRALTYGIATDVGKLRDNNEDACFAMQWHTMSVENRPDFGFFAVADGMGGHLDGERAAGIAVQTLASEMLHSVYMPLLRNFKAAEKTTILEALVAASEKANSAVIDAVPGGGTTLSTVAIVGNLAYLVHVGDSRAYLIHNDEIEQLTTDHTLVQRLIEMKELTPEEAEYYPQKNVLYRAIGQNESLKVERLIRTLPSAAQMLICSDGLWDLVNDETMKRVTLESPSPQEACDRLVSLANDRGGTDNISVIILNVPENDVSI
ncbi:MAG: protein phosphatase 2C domain-containing protein [Chloroflexi bacterium]|nr:protein phosphatase 2C domain-containing protein [Chloroflexota bacterium]